MNFTDLEQNSTKVLGVNAKPKRIEEKCWQMLQIAIFSHLSLKNK